MQAEACSLPLTVSGFFVGCGADVPRISGRHAFCGLLEFALIIFEQYVALGWVSFILGNTEKEAVFVMSRYHTHVSSPSNSISEARTSYASYAHHFFFINMCS